MSQRVADGPKTEEKKSAPATQRKPVAKQEQPAKEETLDDIAGSDDDEDLDMQDDPMAFIERQDSEQTDMKNLFEDDPKAKARQEMLRAKAEAKAKAVPKESP